MFYSSGSQRTVVETTAMGSSGASTKRSVRGIGDLRPIARAHRDPNGQDRGGVQSRLEHFQAVRDEIRQLLLDFFEYEGLLQTTTDTFALATLEENFDDLRKRLKAWWVFHEHVCAFIPGLVSTDASVSGIAVRREARREALQYLLTLLPETPAQDL
jgi:hypothetical protein